MLPGVYGFTWDAGNVIFLGIFFTVAAVIFGTVSLAAVRAYKDHQLRKHGAIRWLEDFHDLPSTARVCRHVLTGELAHRTCPNGFDCRVCEKHGQLQAIRVEQQDSRENKGPSQLPLPLGFHMPLDRLYHRGHTWVRVEEDGIATIGLDDFSNRIFGAPDQVELPPVGTQLQVNRPGWTMKRRGLPVRILSPLDGTVVETGSAENGWYLKVRPLTTIDTRHLLHGDEVHPWIAAEVERLRTALRSAELAPTLADGGEPVADLPASMPEADWDGIWGEIFLEP